MLMTLSVSVGLVIGTVTPPWQRGPQVPSTRGDAVVVAQAWSAAENRRSCAPLTFNSVRFSPGPTPRPRIAYFGGGWGVAWDQPGRRSAFGVAGAGVIAREADVLRWPTVIRYSDGSAVGYGLVGDRGPGHLAYLRVRGQRCLYNVWSDLGVAHLRRLVGQIRRVSVEGPA